MEHFLKGKTYEEAYGKSKALKIKRKQRAARTIKQRSKLIKKIYKDKPEIKKKISEGLKTPMQELEETISPSDIVTSVKSLNDIDIEDFKTKLEDLKVPLLEFLSSFLGKEGLLVSLTDLLSKTMDYVVYIPSLVKGLATEGESVDSLTSKYNALADAKDRLRSSLDAIHHANSGSVNPNTL